MVDGFGFLSLKCCNLVFHLPACFEQHSGYKVLNYKAGYVVFEVVHKMMMVEVVDVGMLDLNAS